MTDAKNEERLRRRITENFYKVIKESFPEDLKDDEKDVLAVLTIHTCNSNEAYKIFNAWREVRRNNLKQGLHLRVNDLY